MPSRRKSAHTTKIERVPRYEVYHGEEDLDDRLSSDGTLDLSMKRIKVEPPDYGDGRDSLHPRPGRARAAEMESDPAAPRPADAVVTGDSTGDESEERSAPSIGRAENSADSEIAADDTEANASASGDHVTAQADAQSSTEECAADEAISAHATAASTTNGASLFPQSSKGKAVRPFKLYTANHDLLSGLVTQGAPTVGTYSVPLALSTVPGAVSLAFASVPLATGAPMIPVTASSTTTSVASSADAMGAGTNTSTSSAKSTSSSTTTDAHLMTLATEADKILRERHESGESSSGSNRDSLEGNTAESLYSSGDETAMPIAIVANEEGTVLKIPSLGGGKASNGDGDNNISFIQKRAVAAAVAASHPHKSKKKRQTLPDQMKDIAYWERRRKNNEAAKRSRDARRAKEDQIAIRAALLEQENIRLKIEVTALKEETAKLRSMLYANNNTNNS